MYLITLELKIYFALFVTYISVQVLVSLYLCFFRYVFGFFFLCKF